LGLATRQFATFDDAIRATAAVSGASGAALQSLNDKARELGATTSYTAVEVANLMTELGRAGFRPDQIEAMTGAVLDLARATGTDATLAAGIMAASIRQFGLEAGDAARVADVLTKAANSTDNTVEGLGESLKYAGPVAKSLGMSLEDTVAVLGVLGNVGIQGSEAGTALRRLSVIAAGSGDELQKIFGITNTDAAGNLKPLVQILDEINTVTANMPVAERTAKMAQAFGLLGITSANVLSQTAGGVRDLAASLQDAEGTVARTAKEMDAGLGGAIRITLSAIEGVALAIGDALAPSLQSLLEGVTAVAGGLTAFLKDNKDLVVSVAQGVAIFTAAGVALVGLGSALGLASFAASGFAGALAAIGSVAAISLSIALSPIGLMAAALAGLVAFGPQIKASFGGMFDGVVDAAGSVGSTLATIASDAMAVFSDLASIASTTFQGIFDAIAAGDLAGAMDILWAGLNAGWLRGTEALMGQVDQWVTFFQDSFTLVSTAVLNVWDDMASGITQVMYTLAAVLMGIVDNIVNGVIAAFDAMVSAVKKSWNWVQSFIVKGYDLAKENAKVDSEMAARARQREQDRPGFEGRLDEASRERKKVRQYAEDQKAERNAAAGQAMDDRQERNRQRAAERRQQTTEAESQVTGMARGARASRAYGEQAADLEKRIGDASSIEQLRDLYGEFEALSGSGKLTDKQTASLETALEDAQERISRETGGMGAGSQIRSGAGAAASDASASKGEVAGTFSAAAVGQMGFGSQIAEQQLEVQRKIERNTREEGALAVQP
jgi:TP901 family phage tail tape measure protein